MPICPVPDSSGGRGPRGFSFNTASLCSRRQRDRRNSRPLYRTCASSLRPWIVMNAERSHDGSLQSAPLMQHEFKQRLLLRKRPNRRTCPDASQAPSLLDCIIKWLLSQIAQRVDFGRTKPNSSTISITAIFYASSHPATKAAMAAIVSASARSGAWPSSGTSMTSRRP